MTNNIFNILLEKQAEWTSLYTLDYVKKICTSLCSMEELSTIKLEFLIDKGIVSAVNTLSFLYSMLSINNHVDQYNLLVKNIVSALKSRNIVNLNNYLNEAKAGTCLSNYFSEVYYEKSFPPKGSPDYFVKEGSLSFVVEIKSPKTGTIYFDELADVISQVDSVMEHKDIKIFITNGEYEKKDIEKLKNEIILVHKNMKYDQIINTGCFEFEICKREEVPPDAPRSYGISLTIDQARRSSSKKVMGTKKNNCLSFADLSPVSANLSKKIKDALEQTPKGMPLIVFLSIPYSLFNSKECFLWIDQLKSYDIQSSRIKTIYLTVPEYQPYKYYWNVLMKKEKHIKYLLPRKMSSLDKHICNSRSDHADKLLKDYSLYKQGRLRFVGE